jgi:hypothetical protein
MDTKLYTRLNGGATSNETPSINELSDDQLTEIAKMELAKRLDYMYHTLTQEFCNSEFSAEQQRKVTEQIRCKLEIFMEEMDYEIFKNVK